MASFSHISGAEPSTVTFKAATVTQTRNSSAMHQEIISIGDPESSLGLVAVLGAAPASTTFGMVVRRVGDSTSIIHGDSTVFQGSSLWQVQISNGNSSVTITSIAAGAGRLNIGSTAADNLVLVSGNSTVAPLAGSTWNVRPVQSSQADLRATVYQSTAADLQATVTQASSLWQVQVSNGNSSVTITTIAAGAGRINIGSTAADNLVLVSGNSTVAPLAGSTWATRPIQSSAADLQMTATPVAGSTWNTRPIQSSAADLQVTATQSAAVWTVNIGTHIQSSAAPSSASSGVVVRLVVDNLLTTASTSAFASTALTIQSSGAALRSYVTAYSITTTNAGPSKIAFYSSGVVLWPILLAAVSSAVSGVNLAVSPPGYLFRTIGAADALTLNLGGGASTVGGWRVGVSYFRAP